MRLYVWEICCSVIHAHSVTRIWPVKNFFMGIDEAEESGRLVSASMLRRARQMIGELSSSAPRDI